MKIGIIGCGLIGKKRAKSLQQEDQLIACCDTNPGVLEEFAKDFDCKAFTNYRTLIDECNLDAIVVAVVNKFALPIVNYALSNGIHVLAEKPLGRNSIEAEEMLRNSIKFNVILKTGFNHRFHPAIWKAKEIFDCGKIGKLLYIRATYGHGGRPGMENEWRSSKDLCGGGELLDQGVHIIDLCRWFTGDIKSVFAKIETKFWHMSVEDNAFVYMESFNGSNIQFHVSWTNWKNIFSFEVFGQDGYLKIDGLGGSYGNETLEIGIRKKEGGRPIMDFLEFPSEDISWKEEWIEFKNSIKEGRDPIGNGLDGLKANLIIESLYKSSKEECIIDVRKVEL